MTDKIDKLKIAMGLADDGITPLSEPLTVVEVPSSEFQENKLFQQKLLDLLDVRKPKLPEDFGKFLTLRLGTDVNSNTQGVLMAAWEGIKVASEDSTTTEITGDGSAADPIKVEVKISGEEGNQLSVEADGLFVPPLPEDLVYEAPEDGKEYVRKDGTWEELVIPEPVLELKELEDVSVEGATDGQILSYDEAESKWVATDNEGGGLPEAPNDGKLYGRKDSNWEEVPAGGGSGIQSIVAGENVTVDDTDPANPIVSATGGGGSEFVIDDLDNTLAIQDSDFLPISQILEEGISAKYWRITISDNVGGSTSVSDHRCYEVEFRESEFVPASHVGDTIIGENVNRFNPAGRAFDGDTGSYAVRNSMSTPWSLGVEFDVARVIKFVAIYYYTTSAGREGSPGVFSIEVSDDNITWTEMASYNVKEEIVSGGWYTFSVTGTEPQQRKVTVAALTEAIVGDINTVLDSINGEPTP